MDSTAKPPVCLMTGLLRPALAVLAPLSLQGCIVGAMLFGGAAALVVKEGYIDEDTYAGEIATTPRRAYEAAVEVMEKGCQKLELERGLRRVSGSWGRSDVEVNVEPMGVSDSTVRVKARKYMLSDRETAMEIFRLIAEKIEKK